MGLLTQLDGGVHTTSNMTVVSNINGITVIVIECDLMDDRDTQNPFELYYCHSSNMAGDGKSWIRV